MQCECSITDIFTELKSILYDWKIFLMGVLFRLSQTSAFDQDVKRLSTKLRTMFHSSYFS